MFNLNAQIKKVEEEDSGQLKIAGWASTPSEDRAKDVIQSSAWNKGGLENYIKNPILLFNHNYDKPIGKAEVIRAEEGGLYIEGTIFNSAVEIYSLVKSGVLRTFSVGFLIKDAEYLERTGGLLITDAELLEVSVVSVPCNQDATFELSKSASSERDYEKIIKQFGKETDEDAPALNTNIMDPEEVKKMIADAVAKNEADRLEREAAEAAEKAKAEEENIKITAVVTKTVEEKVTEAVSKAFEENQGAELAQTVKNLEDTLKTYGEDFKAYQASTREGFFPGASTSSEKMWEKGNPEREQIIEAYILSKALKTPLESLESQKALVEKVNADSSVRVSSDKFEQRVSTELLRDIEMDLVIAPMFREIILTSASQIIPIAPDVGYATHQVSGTTLPGTKPNGLLNEVGNVQPYTLREISLRTEKLVSKAYLANDTQEDVILPILPIIREGMVRQHAKSIDQMMLTAGIAGTPFPNMTSKGLANYAGTGSRTITGPAAGGKYTAQMLLNGRRNMGKYGINPQDVVYVVSVSAYFDLLDDPEFKDNFQVGTGTKVTGEIGRVYGSRVMVSAEISEATTENSIGAYVINTRNFIVPRLRGLTTESEYSVEGQHWVLATTQRIGFSELIPGAKSVTAIKYGA